MILKAPGSELEGCCSDFFEQWPERLLNRLYEHSIFDTLLLDLFKAYTPTAFQRLINRGPLLIDAVFCDCPFWGACESIECSSCGRKLCAIIIDANMILLIDQFARQLISITDPESVFDLKFVKPNQDQCDRADEILGALAFQSGHAPVIHDFGSANPPYCYIHEVKRLAWHFLTMHELSHLIPDAAEEWVDINGEIFLQMQEISLLETVSDRWKKELDADTNGLRVILSDITRTSIRDDQLLSWCRCLVAGITMNFIAWDFIEKEFSHGYDYLNSKADSTHPPITYRLMSIISCSKESVAKQVLPTDTSWMLRLSTALSDLHAQPEWGTGNDPE